MPLCESIALRFIYTFPFVPRLLSFRFHAIVLPFLWSEYMRKFDSQVREVAHLHIRVTQITQRRRDEQAPLGPLQIGSLSIPVLLPMNTQWELASMTSEVFVFLKKKPNLTYETITVSEDQLYLRNEVDEDRSIHRTLTIVNVLWIYFTK